MIGLGKWFFLVCIVGSSLPLCVYAQPRPAAAEEEFFAFFNRVCLLTMPRLDKVRAIARLSQWKPVKGDLATLMAPADSASTGEGWAVVEGGRSMYVGISEGKLDGRKMVICAALGTKFDSSELVKIIESNRGSSALSDEVENLQRYRVWKGSVSGQQVLIQLTTAADDTVAGGTLAVMARAPN